MAGPMQDQMQSDGVPVGREGEQAGSPGGGEVGKLVENIGNGLSMLTEVAAQAGAPESAIQKIDQAMQLYAAAVQEMMGGAGPEAPQPAAKGGAVPMQGPEGRPMGPQGAV